MGISDTKQEIRKLSPVSIVVHARQRELQLCNLGSDGLWLEGKPLHEGRRPAAVDVVPHKEQHLDAAQDGLEEEGCIGVSLPCEGVHQVGYVPMPTQADS